MTPKLLPSVALGLSVALGGGLILVVAGCGSSESDPPNTSATPASTETPAHVDSGHDHSEHDHGQAGHSEKTDMEKMTEALADFSEADRQSAMKQHFCPVSDEMLGTMGAPEKIQVEGKTVWICCDGCKDKLLAEPQKYLAKLK